jgi:hypothetical protein
MYSLSSTEPQLGQENNRSDRTELCTASAVQNHIMDKTITDRTEQSYVRSAMVLSKLWFCTAQAVHRSVLSALLLSCPSCDAVLLKLYIVLFCPICYCLSDRTELCTASAVQNHIMDKTITDRTEQSYVQLEQYRTPAWTGQ